MRRFVWIERFTQTTFLPLKGLQWERCGQKPSITLQRIKTTLLATPRLYLVWFKATLWRGMGTLKLTETFYYHMLCPFLRKHFTKHRVQVLFGDLAFQGQKKSSIACQDAINVEPAMCPEVYYFVFVVCAKQVRVLKVSISSPGLSFCLFGSFHTLAEMTVFWITRAISSGLSKTNVVPQSGANFGQYLPCSWTAALLWS